MDEFLANMRIKAKAVTTGLAEFSGPMGNLTTEAGAWHGSYMAWRTATAAVPAATLAFEDKMAGLSRSAVVASSPLEVWDSTIRTEIPYLGPVYRELFPHGREGFTRGSYELRLIALEALGKSLSAQTTKPVLVALGMTVTAFAIEALALRQTQVRAKAALERARLKLETHRVACAIAIYQVVGCGMMVWGATPELVDTLFEISIIRSPARTVPAAPVNTLWTPETRTLSTTVLPAPRSRLEAWRIAPGGMPEQLHTGDAGQKTVVLPDNITWVSGGTYQIWLVAVNGKGASEPGPVLEWVAA